MRANSFRSRNHPAENGISFNKTIFEDCDLRSNTKHSKHPNEYFFVGDSQLIASRRSHLCYQQGWCYRFDGYFPFDSFPSLTISRYACDVNRSSAMRICMYIVYMYHDDDETFIRDLYFACDANSGCHRQRKKTPDHWKRACRIFCPKSSWCDV